MRRRWKLLKNAHGKLRATLTVTVSVGAKRHTKSTTLTLESRRTRGH